MTDINKHIKDEIKRLPFTLGKLLGGVMAVIGFSGVIIIITRKPNPSYSDILPYLILGIIGFSFFLISARLFEKSRDITNESELTAKEQRHISIISWIIFLIFIAFCILITFIITE